MSIVRRFVLAALMVAVFLVARAGAQTVVTACGQHVAGAAVLAADLDCTGYVGPNDGSGDAAVILDTKGSVLDLAGFTISDAYTGVRCNERCEIKNGTIRDTVGAGVVGEKTTISNMTLTHVGYNTGWGVVTIYSYTLKVLDSTITDAGWFGLDSVSVTLIRSHVSGCGLFGVKSKSMRLVDSTVVDNATSAKCSTPGQLCGDLYSEHKPHLRNSTCGLSRGSKRTPTYRICTNDF